ncbi:SH3 domain-containing protein [Scytonema sp. NUACC26]|uniref:SH3 domain-containing protein n=1 Tax=Scytonema sp. NUACC26 TaxID=3140176 RepID=UPI0034DBDCC5
MTALIVSVIVPEIRRSLHLEKDGEQTQEFELITQTEQGATLPGVKILVISQGAPEVKATDNNGYAKVKLPSKGDVVVNLSKAGYPTQNFTINLENEQSTTRIVQLSQAGGLEVKSSDRSCKTVVADPQDPTLNVRSGPGTQYYKVTELHNGMQIDVVSQRDGWLEINSPIKGWIASTRIQQLCN